MYMETSLELDQRPSVIFVPYPNTRAVVTYSMSVTC